MQWGWEWLYEVFNLMSASDSLWDFNWHGKVFFFFGKHINMYTHPQPRLYCDDIPLELKE